MLSEYEEAILSESKVVRYEPESTVYGYFAGMSREMHGEYVTHADYKALEEINRKLVRKANTLTVETARLVEELTSLKDRVADLVEADRAFADMMIGTSSEYSTQECNAAEERRRIALEALS